jgi:hypothetical protein
LPTDLLLVVCVRLPSFGERHIDVVPVQRVRKLPNFGCERQETAKTLGSRFRRLYTVLERLVHIAEGEG